MPASFERSLALAVLACLASIAGAQGVALHVVDDDGGPGVDFTSIAAAVSAAAPGDVVLVREGIYTQGATIVGTPLVLLAEPGAAIDSQFDNFAVRVDGMPAGGWLAIRGFRPSLHSIHFSVKDASGVVLVEDCSRLTGLPFDTVSFPSGVSVTASAAVHFVRCAIDGSLAPFSAYARGLFLSASQASLWDSSALGASAPPQTGADGKPAVQAEESTLFASGSDFRGGDGGSGGIGPFTSCDGGDGAAGLLLGALGSPSVAHLLDTAIAGGAGAAGTSGCPDGAAADAVVVSPPSVLDLLPGVARSSELQALVVEGQVLGASLRGVPGDAAFLFWSLGAATSPFVPAWNGTGFLAPPHGVIPAGPVPSGAEIALSIPVPPLGLGDRALPLLAQGVFLARSGAVHLGSPTVAVVVGAHALP